MVWLLQSAVTQGKQRYRIESSFFTFNNFTSFPTKILLGFDIKESVATDFPMLFYQNLFLKQFCAQKEFSSSVHLMFGVHEVPT